MEEQHYEVVTLKIDDKEMVNSIVHLFGRSISFIDIRLELDVSGNRGNLELGSFIDEDESVYPFEATAQKGSSLTYKELLERLKSNGEELLK